MTTRGAIALLAALGSLAMAAPQAAVGAPAWVSPQDLSAAGRNASQPRVAIDAAGNAVAVWSRSNGLHTIIQSSSRPAGGAWTPPVDLSAAGRNAVEPQVGIDAAGNATALWLRSNGSHDIVQASSRTPAGAWAPPIDLSAKERDAREPRLAVAPTGWTVGVWSRRDDDSDLIVQASFRPPQGGWGPVDDLSEPGENADEPEVAIDPDGNAVAVWRRLVGSEHLIQGSLRPQGADWFEPDDLSETGQGAKEPHVRMNASGNALAVWTRSDGSDLIVQSAERPAGASWLPPIDASEPGESSSSPQVSFDAAGHAVAVWVRTDTGPYTVVQAGERRPGGLWLAPQDLTGPGQSVASPQVSLDPNGNAIALWARSSGAPTVIEGRIRPPGGAWLAPVNVSALGRTAVEPALAFDPAGNGVAVWAREDGLNTIAQAAGFDGAGPLVHGPAVPADGTVRQALRFSVAAFDVWSPVGTIAWSFGDGTAAHGPLVEHAYERPGTYPVAVTVLDSLGNPSSALGSVTIHRKPAAGRNVRVRRGRALLRLRCPSPAGCSGLLRLVAAVELRRGDRLLRKRRQIGRRTFAIRGAATSKVSVRLTKQGRRAVAKAGRRGLRTQLTGPGVRHRLVVLYAARRKRR